VERGHARVDNVGVSSPLPDSRLARRVQRALDLFVVGLLVLFLAGFVARNVRHAYDLRTYQAAARAASLGRDPYDPAMLAEAAGRPVFPFVYPPIALLPLLPLASRPYAAIAVVWMVLELAVVGALVAGWWRWLKPHLPLSVVAIVALFGWNAAAQWSLASGNVALFECGLVWAALACFAAERRTAFQVLVVAAACCKLAPAAFLLLLLVPTARHGGSVRALLAAVGALAVLVGLPMVIGPAAHWTPFWTHLPAANDAGLANPSGIGFATLLARRFGAGDALAPRIGTLAWLLAAAGLVALGRSVLRDAWRRRDPLRWAALAVFLEVLLQPRPMAYGYLMLTPAPLILAPRPFRDRAGRIGLALVLAAQGLLRLTRNESPSPFFVHAPWLLTVCLWLLVVNESREEARAEAEPRPAETEAAAFSRAA